MPGQSVPASLYSAANPNDLDPWSIFTAKQGGAPATPPRNSSLDFTQSASLGTPPPASCRRFLSRICAHVHGDRQRTRWPPATRAQFDALRGPTGALLIGAAETIAEKILYVSEVLGGLSRITFQMGVSALPHEKMLRSIELLGTRVAPILRKELTTVSSH
jgi:hypothetical protein